MVTLSKAEEGGGIKEGTGLSLPYSQATFWFFVIWLLFFLDVMDRMAITAVFPALKKTYNLRDSELGMLASALSLSLVLFGVPAAWAVDRWSRTKMISIMAIVWSTATGMTAFAGSFVHILIARFFIGVGEAGYKPAGYALIAAWFPKSLRATMSGIFTTAQPLGAFLGVGLAGWIAVKFGWKSVFGVAAIPGVLCAVLMSFAPDYKTRILANAAERSPETKIQPTFAEMVRYILRTKSLLLLYLAGFMTGIWGGALTTWMPSFYGRTFNLDMADAGAIVSICGLASACGAPLCGRLSDRFAARSSSGRAVAILIPIACCLVLMTTALLLALRGAPLAACVSFWALGQAGLAGHWGMVSAAMLDLAPPHYRGVAQSFFFVCLNVMMSVMPVIVGFLSDQFGLSKAMLITEFTGMSLTLLVYYFVYRYYAADLETSHKLSSFTIEK